MCHVLPKYDENIDFDIDFDLDLGIDFGHPFSVCSFGCESVNK